ADYKNLPVALSNEIEPLQSEEAVLDLAARRLAEALSANDFICQTASSEPPAATRTSADAAIIPVPTAEKPQFEILLSRFGGGRRLLSDEIAM
ncbi:hypothetical protein OFP26_31175, partial [Escherichia coli]|nr:hypothetical protein [Escherichia coli]